MKLLKTTLPLFGFLLLTINTTAQTDNSNADAMDDMWGETKVSGHIGSTSSRALFEDGKFGMFIHWGLYSHLAGKWNGKTYYGIAEWIMNENMAGIPVDEYKAVAAEFNPYNFDGMEIARLAKDAGMKYIIITSKHHDGFAMFESKADPFNIVDATPFGRDPMKELAAACRELGLGFGFYYSHYQDWTAPGGFRGPTTHPDGTPATFEDYFYNKCIPQVKEICSNYGKIDFVWFDTPGNMKKELVVELVNVVRELQPEALLSSRTGHGMGDYASLGDMEVPPYNIDGLWETCDTSNDSWSYTWYDKNFKPSKTILNNLVSTVGRGGTYLFNIGPDGKGETPEMAVHFLRKTGEWIAKYPQVIYGAERSPWGRVLPWGDVTASDNSLHLVVFEWPQDGKLYLPGLQSEITSASLLKGSGEKNIDFTQLPDWTIFELPCEQTDFPASVIKLDLNKNAAQAKVDTDYGIYPNIKTELLTAFAEVEGSRTRKIRWMEKFGEWKHVYQISNWKHNNTKATWAVNVKEPGYYMLEMRYRGEDRVVWRTTTSEGDIVQNQQPATSQYQAHPMGILEFKSPGKHTISVTLVEGDEESTSLESIIISPVR